MKLELFCSCETESNRCLVYDFDCTLWQIDVTCWWSVDGRGGGGAEIWGVQGNKLAPWGKWAGVQAPLWDTFNAFYCNLLAYRQTNPQVNWETNHMQFGKQIHRQLGKQIHRQLGKQIHRQFGKQIHRQLGKQIRRQLGKQITGN